MRLTRGKIETAPLFSETADRHIPQVSAEDRERHAYLLAPDGRLFKGHQAMWETLSLYPGGWLLRPLRYLPGFDWIGARLYRWYADHGRRLHARLLSRGRDPDNG